MKLEYSLVMKRYKEGKCPVCGKKNTVNWVTSHEWFRCKDCGSHWFAVHETISLGIKDKSNRGLEIENDMFSVSHIPEILLSVLSQKKILPVLLGIDDELDKFIAERLKK